MKRNIKSPLKSNNKEIFLTFNLPGFKKEDIKIKLSKNSIEIKAEKNTSTEIQRKDFFHSEKSSRNFNYLTNVPDINPKKAKIIFNNGVLKITAPRL